MRRFIFIFLSLTLISFIGVYGMSYKGRFTPIDPHKAVEEMDPGWNLGNSLDAIPDETSWGNPKTEPYIFDDIKRTGFRSVRIPVTWVDHMGPAPNYKVDKEWMDRVEEVVGYALERDLWVIINVHHDSWRWLKTEMKQRKEETMRKLEKLWEQIADRFKDYSEKLIFETINEPDYDGFSDQEKGEIQNEVNERILKVIRNSGGFNDKRLVVLPPVSTDTYKMKYFRAPKDPYIIIGVHYYSPWDFVANWWGRKTWGSQRDIEQMDKDIRTAIEGFENYAFIIGEYGVFNGNRPYEWLYFDYLIRTAKKYKMATFYWDNGYDNYDRWNRKWRDYMKIKIIMNASKGIPNSFLNPGILYIKGDEQIKDQNVELILNGNNFLGIFNGSKELRRGEDYLVDRNKVTIRASYIKSILKPDEWGTNAVLTFKFDRGADYDLEVVQYKKPVVLDTGLFVGKGLPVELKIPIAFNGTKLSAIKVVTANNFRPVRDSWTPYLRGWDDFEVRADSMIVIKKHVVQMFPEDVIVVLEFYPEDESIQLKVKVR